MSKFLGPVMLDLVGTELTDFERELLLHPLTGGVILFSRNFVSKPQIKNLCRQIHALKKPALLIAVDHEGGRVQRFKDGFSRIPAMATLGNLYQSKPKLATKLSCDLGWLMANELREVGVDFSFAPILDIDIGISEVIGDRAFHNTPNGVTELAQAWINGMHLAGMKAVGKHFPGHGSVQADSHIAIPVDNRTFLEIKNHDLIPFENIKNLDAIMPAHVIYSDCDVKPVGFSKFWLQTTLRQQLNFKGVIFSDDLSMEGASQVGNFATRTRLALSTGCDMVLVCNNSNATSEVLQALEYYPSDKICKDLTKMKGDKVKQNLTEPARLALNYLVNPE